MLSKTFKTVLAAAAIAVPVATVATTDAFAWGGHGGGGHFGGGGFRGGHGGGGGFGHRGGGFGGGRFLRGEIHPGHHHHPGRGPWADRPHYRYSYGGPRYVYTGGGSYCGWGYHYSRYWDRCVPNY